MECDGQYSTYFGSQAASGPDAQNVKKEEEVPQGPASAWRGKYASDGTKIATPSDHRGKGYRGGFHMFISKGLWLDKLGLRCQNTWDEGNSRTCSMHFKTSPTAAAQADEVLMMNIRSLASACGALWRELEGVVTRTPSWAAAPEQIIMWTTSARLELLHLQTRSRTSSLPTCTDSWPRAIPKDIAL